MANDQPEDFLLEFLVRAKKRQAKLEEADSSLQPAPKVYHAERIVTSKDDEASNNDNLPTLEEEGNEDLPCDKTIRAIPEYQNDIGQNLPGTIDEDDETSMVEKSSTIDNELECSPEKRSISEKPSTLSNDLDDDDPLDLSEYLDSPVLYRDEPRANPDLEELEKESSKKDLKYSLTIYRKENKHKSSTTPMIVYQPPSSDESSKKSNNEELIRSYEDKIRDVTNIIKQTGRALDLCYEDPKRRGTHEHLECEKLLLTSSFRQLVYTNEIAKIRQSRRQQSLDGTTGTVKLSLIQLQLTNEFLQSMAEEKVLHCFLCLARCGPEIQCTELITSHDIRYSGKRRICFNEPLVFQDIPTNFQLIFEVYELVEEYPKSKKDLNFFAPLTPSKKSTKHVSNLLTPSSLKKERRSAFRSIGMLQVKLDLCHNVSFTLDHVPEPGSIDGVVNMNITLKSVHTIVKKGMLHLLTESNEYPDWIRRWFVLRDGQLLYWRHPEDETVSPPIGIIDLHRCICEKVAPCSPLDDLYRQNSLVLYTSKQVKLHEKNNLLERVYHNFKVIKHQMAANSKDERNSWSDALNFAIETIRRWRSNSVNLMDDVTIKKIMTEDHDNS